MFKVMILGELLKEFDDKWDAIDYTEQASMEYIDYDIKILDNEGYVIKRFRNGGEIG